MCFETGYDQIFWIRAQKRADQTFIMLACREVLEERVRSAHPTLQPEWFMKSGLAKILLSSTAWDTKGLPILDESDWSLGGLERRLGSLGKADAVAKLDVETQVHRRKAVEDGMRANCVQLSNRLHGSDSSFGSNAALSEPIWDTSFYGVGGGFTLPSSRGAHPGSRGAEGLQGFTLPGSFDDDRDKLRKLIAQYQAQHRASWQNGPS